MQKTCNVRILIKLEQYKCSTSFQAVITGVKVDTKQTNLVANVEICMLWLHTVHYTLNTVLNFIINSLVAKYLLSITRNLNHRYSWENKTQ